MRCWLKNSGAKRAARMNDRMSMRVAGGGPPPPPPTPSGAACASQRWKTEPTTRSDGAVLLANVLTDGGSRPLCLSMLEPRAVGLLGVERCNASDARQSWLIDTNTGAIQKAEPERRCLVAPSERASTGMTIWGKRVTGGFAVVFFNQNSGTENVTCGPMCMANLLALASNSSGGPASSFMHVRDLWSHTDLPGLVDTSKGFSATVSAGGSASVKMFKLMEAST
jgi:hypothetical protein